jgi:hypothetical protein
MARTPAKNRVVLIGLILFTFSTLVACHERRPDWPEQIVNSLWVSPDAVKVHYYTLYGSYQVSYRAPKVCHPAKGFMEGMVKQMEEKGWKRLDFDDLNPGLRLNHARPGSLWSNISDRDGKNVLQWMDEWKDPDKNVVTYGLKYMVTDSNFRHVCNLDVVVIYTPSSLKTKEAP